VYLLLLHFPFHVDCSVFSRKKKKKDFLFCIHLFDIGIPYVTNNKMVSTVDIEGDYSPVQEAGRILDFLCKQSKALELPSEVVDNKDAVSFSSTTNQIYFPIPFKETETIAALKGIEALVAASIADLRYGQRVQKRSVKVSLERATCFGCQAYMAKVDGLGKLDPGVRAKLKGLSLPIESYIQELLLTSTRHGSHPSSIEWLPEDVGEPLPDQK
jgi:hypothetical protein